MRFCSRFKRLIIAQEGKRVLVTRTRCKQWECPYCGAINSKIWKYRIANGIEVLGIESWWFITITSTARAHKYARTLENLRGGFDRLSKRMRRLAKRQGVRLHYVRVFEKHRSGALHIHALVNFPFTKRWLKDNAKQCGMGYQAHSRPVAGVGLAVWYTTKYLAKSLAGEAMPKSIRRINTSHGWPALPETGSDLDWNIAVSISEDWLWNGYTVHDIPEGRDLDHDDFWDFGYYPPREAFYDDTE